jgi:hypothetical protein
MKMEVLGFIISLLVIGLILLAVIGSRVKTYKKYRKANLLYALAAAGCFFIIGLTGFFGLAKVPLYFFIVIQALILIMGILHIYLLFKLLPWAASGKFVGEFLFSLAITIFGAAFLLLAFTLLKLHDHRFVFLSALVWFMVPLFFRLAFHRLYSIPPKILKNWFYQSDKAMEDPTDSELESPVIVSFVFLKNRENQEMTIFRAKAPKAMKFGRLFYYFINDYNDRNPGEAIEVVNNENNPFGWIFYHKQKLPLIRHYLDPDETVHENRIRENSIIVCRRVEEL